MRALAVLRVAAEVVLIGLATTMAVERQAPCPPVREKVIYRVPTAQKIVALTYDDGPHPKFTPEILRVLDKYHVKATFFMIGSRMEQYPDIVRAVLARGHVIGNHTYTHPKDILLDTPAQVIREIDKCEEVIERMTGRRTQLFRPPKGLLDGPVLQIAEEEGYRTVLWSVSADHRGERAPLQMAQRVLSRVRPGSIILAHDGTYPMRWRDVAATPLIIEGLRRRGYRFVTVPELLEQER